jgi:hypothetical protein
MVMVTTSISETSVNYCQTTRHKIPEESHLHSRRCENLRSNILSVDLWLLSNLHRNYLHESAPVLFFHVFSFLPFVIRRYINVNN